MRHEKRVRALRLVPVMAALGTILTGCGLPSDGRYGGGSNHYGSPGYYRPSSHHRSGGHHKPRTENWSQERLRQHWLNQAQRPR